MPKTPVRAKLGPDGAQNPSYTFRHMAYALACDPIYGLSHATHAQGRSRAWNLLYSDGSVPTAVTDTRAKLPDGGWDNFLEMLGYLERIADGQETVGAPEGTKEYKMIPIDPPGPR